MRYPITSQQATPIAPPKATPTCCTSIYHCHARAVGSSPGVRRLIDESGDAGEGSEVEVRSADDETFRAKRGKNFSP